MTSRPSSASAPGRPQPPLRRPASQPELSRRGVEQRLTKLLLNVTVERSTGPVHVLMSPEETVADLVRAAVMAYGREGRRPLLPKGSFELHYSQYSLESLDPEQKLINLGSRNFFLCSTSSPAVAAKSSEPGGGPRAFSS